MTSSTKCPLHGTLIWVPVSPDIAANQFATEGCNPVIYEYHVSDLSDEDEDIALYTCYISEQFALQHGINCSMRVVDSRIPPWTNQLHNMCVKCFDEQFGKYVILCK